MFTPIKRLVVLLGLLAAAPLADAGTLQERVEALGRQLELRFARSQRDLASKRHETESVLSTWNNLPASAKNAADNREELTEWIDAAIAAAMPGGSGELPAPPRFRADIDLPRLTAERSAVPEPLPFKPEIAAPFSRQQKSAKQAGRPTPANPARAESEWAGGRPAESLRPEPSLVRPLNPATVNPTESQERTVAKPVVPNEPAVDGVADPRGESTRRSKWSRHPAAAPLEWRDPFADDPDASPNPLRSGARREARKPLARASTSVSVNVANLAAEIRGYNSAVRSLHRRLLDDSPESGEELAALERQLDELGQRREFLLAYRGRVGADERWGLPEVASGEALRELVRRRREQTAGSLRGASGVLLDKSATRHTVS